MVDVKEMIKSDCNVGQFNICPPLCSVEATYTITLNQVGPVSYIADG